MKLLKKIKYLILFFGFIAFYNTSLFCQKDVFYYGSNNNFQSNLLNPSFKLEAKLVINVLSNVNTNINLSNINLSNIFNKNISVDTTIRNIINDPNINFNNISQNLQWNLLYVGYTIKKNTFISIGTILKQNLALNLPEDFIGLAFIGNTYYNNVLKRPVALNNLKFESNAYLETHVGITQTVNDKIQFGVRLKYLSGLYNASLDKSNFNLESNIDSLTIQGNLRGRIGGIYDVVSGKSSDFFSNRKLFAGNGGGIDLGFEYKIDNKNVVSASLLDLGFIRWNSQSGIYNSQNINYKYKGVGLDNFELTDSVFSELTDTLKNIFKISDEPLQYTQYLKPRFFLGWTYLISWKYKVDVVVYNDFNEFEFNPAIMASFSQKVGEVLDFRYSALFYNKRFESFGLGMNVNIGAFQLSLGTSNIFAPFFYDKNYLFNFNIGSTLLFGRIQRGKKLKENIDKLQHLTL